MKQTNLSCGYVASYLYPVWGPNMRTITRLAFWIVIESSGATIAFETLEPFITIALSWKIE